MGGAVAPSDGVQVLVSQLRMYHGWQTRYHTIDCRWIRDQPIENCLCIEREVAENAGWLPCEKCCP